MKINIIALVLLFANLGYLQAQNAIPAYQSGGSEQIGIYEHLDETIPDNIMLLNNDSVLVNLKSLINKPTVISFVYYNCPGICSPLLDGLAEVIDRAEMNLGTDYQVITISFNPTDGPSLGKAKKANYVAQIKRQVDAENWMWFTGDSANIAAITDAMGFKYKREGKEFVHAASIMVVSPHGKITRYLHGTYFLPFDLKMAIIEANEERSGPTINKVLKYCFSYDAEGKKYVFNTTKITGTVVLSGALLLFLVLAFKPRKNDQIEQSK